MNNSEPVKKYDPYLNSMAGASIGALLGLLLGLSTSPVVGGVITGLVGILGGFLIAAKKNKEDTNVSEYNSLKVIFFSVSCILFMVIGIYVRSNGLISGSHIVDQYQQLISIGFTEEEARTYAIKEINGTSGELSKKSSIGALFSSDDGLGCGDLDPDSFDNVQDLITTYSNTGGEWAAVSSQWNLVPNISDKQILQFAKTYHAARCN